MILSSQKDFIIPVLTSLHKLGGTAYLSEIEDEFYKHFSKYLDPAKDWCRITRNHNKPLWKDYCGSRVAYRFLVPNNYILVERHGHKGSVWKLTEKGESKLERNHIT